MSVSGFPADGTIAARLAHWARERPHDLAFSFRADGAAETERLSFAALHRRALSIMQRLQQEDLAGRTAILAYPPGLEFCAAFFGCLYAGVVAAPAPYLLPRRARARIAGMAREARPAAVLSVSGLMADEELAALRSDELAGVAWIATDLELGDPRADGPAPAADDQTALLQFTSGSTSAPKGVMVTHGALIANLAMIRDAFGHGPDTRFASWLPVHHDMGLIGCMLQPVYLGVPCVMMSPLAFLQRPVRWLRAISEARATTSGAPNFAYELCAAKVTPAQLEGLDLSCWSVAFCGAEPVRPDTLERFARTMAPAGFRTEALFPCYGLAEATLFVSGGPRGAGLKTLTVDGPALAEDAEARPTPADAPGARRLASSGRCAWGGQTVAILAPGAETPVAPGGIGEICVLGDHVAKGYWERPAETRETFAASGAVRRLRTGDLGFMHDGDLYVTGRLKDLVIVRGAKHHPEDIEATVAASHQALTGGGGAVFALEGAREEQVVILQELERRSAGRADLDLVALAAFAAVSDGHGIRAYDLQLLRPGSLPRTTSGKVQRRRSRAAYLAGELKPLTIDHPPAGLGRRLARTRADG